MFLKRSVRGACILMLLTFCLSAADDRDELKDILGSGEVKKPIVKASTTSTTPALPSPNNSSVNNKKLNIVVSSIDENGFQEVGQRGTEVSVAPDENFTSNNEKTPTKTNHVSLVLHCLTVVYLFYLEVANDKQKFSLVRLTMIITRLLISVRLFNA